MGLAHVTSTYIDVPEDDTPRKLRVKVGTFVTSKFIQLMGLLIPLLLGCPQYPSDFRNDTDMDPNVPDQGFVNIYQTLRPVGITWAEDPEHNFLVELRSEITGQTIFQTARQTVEGSLLIDVSGLPLPIQVHVALDSNKSTLFEPCPFPPSSDTLISTEAFDLWQANGRLVTLTDEPYPLNFVKRSCGPGTSGTSWSARLQVPSGATSQLSKLLVTAEILHNEETAPFKITWALDEIPAAEDGTLNLEFDELLPGTYTLRVFSDNDADGRFTPCINGQPGGGDRYYSQPLRFELNAGTHQDTADPIVVQDAMCELQATTVSGLIDLSIVDAESGRQTDGNLVIEVASVESQQTVYRRTLTRSHSLSESFLISALPEMPLELSAYIDRDLDGQFMPCTQNGQDLYVSLKVPFTLSPGETIALSPLRLEGEDCHANTLSRIAGQISMPPPGERRESGRPIYVTIYDETQETTETTRIVDEHLMAITPRSFDINLAPGSYRFFAFVDTEPDAIFTPCQHDPFGDRASSDSIDFELRPYELLDVGSLVVRRLGCDFPTVSFLLSIELEEVPIGTSQMDVVILLTEAGGFEETLIFSAPPVAPPWYYPIGDLVPGQYTVEVFLDGNGDQVRQACSEGLSNEYGAIADFEIGREIQNVERALVLERDCEDESAEAERALAPSESDSNEDPQP